jgi:hypothetical protein
MRNSPHAGLAYAVQLGQLGKRDPLRRSPTYNFDRLPVELGVATSFATGRAPFGVPVRYVVLVRPKE